MPIGSFGTINFQVPELLDHSFSDRINYVIIDKVSGYPTVQQVGDDLGTKVIRLRFNYTYNTNPQNDFSLLRTAALGGIPQTLTLLNRDWGKHVITAIDWSVALTTIEGEPYEIDASVSFLHTPIT